MHDDPLEKLITQKVEHFDYSQEILEKREESVQNCGNTW